MLGQGISPWTKETTPEFCEAYLRNALEAAEDTPWHPMPLLVVVVSLLDRIRELETEVWFLKDSDQ